MDIKAELLKIKSYLMSSETPVEPTSQAFAMYDLEGGGQVSINGEIAVGADVMVIDGDGNEVPAPNGEHVLVGVAKIKTDAGKIMEIMPLEEEASIEVEIEAGNKEEEMAEAEPMPDHAMEMESMSERITKLEGMLADMMTRMDGMGKATEAMTAVVEVIASAPTAEVSKPASFTYVNPKTSQEKKFENLLNALNK
jgi:hypothetical protein